MVIIYTYTIITELCEVSFLIGDKTKELPYMVMLNSTLPEDIRVLAWAPVGPDFSARFNCLHRTYKYFFPKGNIDIDVRSSSATANNKHICAMHGGCLSNEVIIIKIRR